MLSVLIADRYGQQWCTAFGETAQQLLRDITADRLEFLKQTGDEAGYDQIFNNALYQENYLKIRAKSDVYQDERRTRVIIVDTAPIDYKYECSQILHAIQSYNI